MRVKDKIFKYIGESNKNDSAYQAFFREMLDKYGVDSPDELSDEEKKKFFNEIDRKFKSKKEMKEMNESIVSIKNLDRNFMLVTMGDVSVWFSYETPVAFLKQGQKKVVRKNEWSTTTGKHINKLEPDKNKRVDGKVFISMLKKILY
ncbi:MAG: hypothetical protein ACOC56_01685 [Atribacterota bacterium]